MVKSGQSRNEILNRFWLILNWFLGQKIVLYTTLGYNVNMSSRFIVVFKRAACLHLAIQILTDTTFVNVSCEQYVWPFTFIAISLLIARLSFLFPALYKKPFCHQFFLSLFNVTSSTYAQICQRLNYLTIQGRIILNLSDYDQIEKLFGHTTFVGITLFQVTGFMKLNGTWQKSSYFNGIRFYLYGKSQMLKAFSILLFVHQS